MMRSVSHPGGAGWRVWRADLKETKDFVSITERRPATAFIVIFALHLTNPDITESCCLAKQSKTK